MGCIQGPGGGGPGSSGVLPGGVCGPLGGVGVPRGAGLLSAGVCVLSSVRGGEGCPAGGCAAGVCSCSGGWGRPMSRGPGVCAMVGVCGSPGEQPEGRGMGGDCAVECVVSVYVSARRGALAWSVVGRAVRKRSLPSSAAAPRTSQTSLRIWWTSLSVVGRGYASFGLRPTRLRTTRPKPKPNRKHHKPQPAKEGRHHKPYPNTPTQDPSQGWRGYRNPHPTTTRTQTQTPHNSRKPSAHSPGTKAARAMQVTRPNEIRRPRVRLHPKACAALGLEAERATPKRLGTSVPRTCMIALGTGYARKSGERLGFCPKEGTCASTRAHPPGMTSSNTGGNQPSRCCPGPLCWGPPVRSSGM